MSVSDQAATRIITHLVLAADGAVLGVALAYLAVRTVLKFNVNSSALRMIQDAPSVRISDLRSVISSSNSDTEINSNSDTKSNLVVVRGLVKPKSSVEGNWRSLRPKVLVSQHSGDEAVVVQRTLTCIYNEWRGFFGWPYDLRSLFVRSRKEKESSSTTVPFVLVEAATETESDYVIVNMSGSRHQLPLTTVYQHLQPITSSPYTFLHAVFGHEYPVGILDEEKILPVGKDVSAVGLCCVRNGIPEIKSCEDLPYFLSDMTKDELVVDLAFKTKVLFWGGIVFGTLAIGVFGYAAVRNWNKWKAWRRHRQIQQQNAAAHDGDTQIEEEENEDVPDGELCVICLMRRRRSAFLPCGHLVCCQRCALSVEREVAPKCPVCRQTIRSSVMIFNS